MHHYTLFSDVSVNPQLKTGMGAYLLLPHSLAELQIGDTENVILSEPQRPKNPSEKSGFFTLFRMTQTDIIKSKIFENTSSTKAEFQTLLWALSEIENILIAPFKLTICTDSQGITSLIARKQKLISSNFMKNEDEKIRNAELYDEFYNKQELLNFEIVKIKGHSPKSQKDNLQLIFTLIDRKVRSELRNYLDKNKLPQYNSYYTTDKQ